MRDESMSTSSSPFSSSSVMTTGTGSARERRNRRLAAMHQGMRSPGRRSTNYHSNGGGTGSPSSNSAGVSSSSPPLSPKSPSPSNYQYSSGISNTQNTNTNMSSMRRPASPYNIVSSSSRPPMGVVSPNNHYALSLSTSRYWENSNNNNEGANNTSTRTNVNTTAPPLPAGLQQPQLSLTPRYRSVVTPRSSPSDRSVSSEVFISRNDHHLQQQYRVVVPTGERESDLQSIHSTNSDSKPTRLSRQEIRRLATNRLMMASSSSRRGGGGVLSSSASLPGEFLSPSASPRLLSPTPASGPNQHLLRSYNSPSPQVSPPGRGGGGIGVVGAGLPTMTANVTTFDDDVSSLGGVEDQASSVSRMTLALKNRSARPSSLTREERALWDAIQTSVKQAKSENSKTGSPKQPHQQQEQEQPPTSPVDWKQKHNELQDRTAAQEREHLSSLRAIQRVLADATAERDKAVDEQKRLRLEQQEAAAVAAASSCREGPEDDTGELRKEVQSLRIQISGRDARIQDLEDELHEAREESSTQSTSVSLDRQKEEFLRQRLESSEAEKNRLAAELESNREEITKLSRRLLQQDESSVVSSSEVADLQVQLSEKLAALESAKMIIASLENASGSLAADMRAKVKGKEDEVAHLRAEASDRQKTVDSLAMQLRDLQRSRASTKHRQRMDEERSRRLGLSSRLEKNMAEIRAASVVLEATNDPATAEQVSELLSDSILALRDGIDVIEAEDSDADAQSTASCNDSVSVSSRGIAPVDVRRLWKDLDERTRALNQAEEALRREKENSARLRAEKEEQCDRDEEVQSLRKDVNSLREQCQTNMEVLTRKERELAVLRDSLKVDDGVGYISDDGSDGTESEAGTEAAVSSVPPFGVYGPSQAEALATLLVHSGSGPMDATKDSGELEVVRKELLQARTDMEKCRKQLKTEKESLANAKMIISSLEKANKSMMEDLRSRLQDSNTAIASLLEKSMQSEKNTSRLREELEALKNEKEEERARYESELEKWRSDTPTTTPMSLIPSSPSSPASPVDSIEEIMEEKKIDFLPPPPPETID